MSLSKEKSYAWVTTPPRTPYRERPAIVYEDVEDVVGKSLYELYRYVRYMDGRQEVEEEVSIFRLRPMSPLEALAWGAGDLS